VKCCQRRATICSAHARHRDHRLRPAIGGGASPRGTGAGWAAAVDRRGGCAAGPAPKTGHWLTGAGFRRVRWAVNRLANPFREFFRKGVDHAHVQKRHGGFPIGTGSRQPKDLSVIGPVVVYRGTGARHLRRLRDGHDGVGWQRPAAPPPESADRGCRLSGAVLARRAYRTAAAHGARHLRRLRDGHDGVGWQRPAAPPPESADRGCRLSGDQTSMPVLPPEPVRAPADGIATATSLPCRRSLSPRMRIRRTANMGFCPASATALRSCYARGMPRNCGMVV
jgi:hypothetical protein